MSFFGFNTTLPRDQSHDARAPGFAQAPDPFAGLSRPAEDDEEILDFEDTYDGLGDKLEETGDAFNDDTFGDDTVGKDFDFAGQTARMDTAPQQQQQPSRAPPVQQQQRQPESRSIMSSFRNALPATKPARTGYENYKEPGYIPQLEASASIWGTTAPKKQQTPEPAPVASPPVPAAQRKMMSLEEVEAAMRAKKITSPPPMQESVQQPPQTVQPNIPGQPTQILQRPRQDAPSHPQNGQTGPQGFQQHQQQQPPHPYMHQGQMPPNQPRQILQRPDRMQQMQGQQPMTMNRGSGPIPVQQGRNMPGPIPPNPQQLMQMTPQDRAALIEADAKRAKRIHKIQLLSKDNGLMTPQDKNFITRVQLQQLVTATGEVDDAGPEAKLAEDFYYQVFSQIRARQGPNQPLNQFAQTYLYQTGGRYGAAGRRQNRGADNHAQRLQQQVQRAVEVAKAKPKNKQLIIEGSLGKISFSNSKTPKPLLNLKRSEAAEARANSAPRAVSRGNQSVAYRRATLKSIEEVYSVLMQMEDHERKLPPPPTEQDDPERIQEHIEWRQQMAELNQQLWKALKVMEPIGPNSPVAHPFIAILSHSKGKKAIPRIFRHIDEQQRTTVMTMLAVQFDQLDVVRLAAPTDINSPPLPVTGPVKEEVETFSQAVMPVLLSFINDAPLNILLGLLGVLLDHANVALVMKTRVGLAILTMLVSRAELVRQSQPEAQAAQNPDIEQWTQLYSRLFDMAEAVLPILFPTTNTTSRDDPQAEEDVHIWQFLAAMGVGASPEQQQRLVMGVKDKVMEVVSSANDLPPEVAAHKLGNVNLFMRAIGLDVSLLG